MSAKVRGEVNVEEYCNATIAALTAEAEDLEHRADIILRENGIEEQADRLCERAYNIRQLVAKLRGDTPEDKARSEMAALQKDLTRLQVQLSRAFDHVNPKLSDAIRGRPNLDRRLAELAQESFNEAIGHLDQAIRAIRQDVMGQKPQSCDDGEKDR